jgi:multidrug efflux pump subunit AcrA (membrane-fusion protein)
MSKSRLFVSALAVAGLGAVALGYAAPQFAKTWRPHADRSALAQTAPADAVPVTVAEAGKGGVRVEAPGTQVEAGRDVRVDAPHTAVRVNKDSGKVAVRAPLTDVKVDPDKGQVRVRAPYVNLDIRW